MSELLKCTAFKKFQNVDIAFRAAVHVFFIRIIRSISLEDIKLTIWLVFSQIYQKLHLVGTDRQFTVQIPSFKRLGYYESVSH